MQELTQDDLRRTLGSHVGWMKALAAELLHDAQRGEDVAQDAIAAALGSSSLPAEPHRLRGWLRIVTRNLSFQSLRHERLRSRIERDHNAALAVEGDMDALEKLEWASAITKVVSELPDAYRKVIVMRYFDGLRPVEIARTLEEPAATTRQRLSRALELLRSNLDASVDGGRTAWCLGFGGWLAVDTKLALLPLAILMNAKLISILVAGLVVLTVVIGSREDPTPILSSAPAVEVRPVKPPELPAQLAANQETSAVPSARAEVTSIVAASPSVTGLEGLVISGKVMPVDLTVQSSELHGQLVLREGIGMSKAEFVVPIVAGKWSLEFDEPAPGQFAWGGQIDEGIFSLSSFVPVRVELASGLPKVLLTESHQFIAGGERDASIEICLNPPVELEVLDKLTGTHLQVVTVLTTGTKSKGALGGIKIVNPACYDNFDPVIVEEPSPLQLFPNQRMRLLGTRACLIGSPGYAWKHVRLDFSGEGHRRVELEPAGSLRIEIEGDPGQADTYLKVRDPNSKDFHAFYLLKGDDVLEIDGMPAGEVSIKLFRGRPKYHGEDLAETSAMIKPGRQELRKLSVSPSDVVSAVPLSGTLVLPQEWTEMGLGYSLRFELRGAPQDGTDGRRAVYIDQGKGLEPEGRIVARRIPGEQDTYKFDVGLVEPGSYWAKLDFDSQKHFAIEVGPQGNTDVRLVMTPPVELIVTVEDSATGNRLHRPELSWTRSTRKRVHLDSWEKAATYDKKLKEHRLMVPEGTVQLLVGGGENYVKQSHIVEAKQGLRVRMQMESLYGIRIILQHEGTMIPWSDAEVQLEDSAGVKTSKRVYRLLPRTMSDIERRGRVVSVREPGTYRMTIQPIPGFEDIEPFSVDFRLGDPVERIIELTRLP